MQADYDLLHTQTNITHSSFPLAEDTHGPSKE